MSLSKLLGGLGILSSIGAVLVLKRQKKHRYLLHAMDVSPKVAFIIVI